MGVTDRCLYGATVASESYSGQDRLSMSDVHRYINYSYNAYHAQYDAGNIGSHSEFSGNEGQAGFCSVHLAL